MAWVVSSSILSLWKTSGPSSRRSRRCERPHAIFMKALSLTRRDGPDSVRIRSNSKKRPPSAFSDEDESRRWREGTAGRRMRAIISSTSLPLTTSCGARISSSCVDTTNQRCVTTSSSTSTSTSTLRHGPSACPPLIHRWKLFYPGRSSAGSSSWRPRPACIVAEYQTKIIAQGKK